MKNNKIIDSANSTSLLIGLGNNNSELKNFNKNINNYDNIRISLTKDGKKRIQNKNNTIIPNSKNYYEINRTKSSSGTRKITINDNNLAKYITQNKIESKEKNDYLISNEDILNNFLLFMNDSNSQINKSLKENNPFNLQTNAIQKEHFKSLNINHIPKIITPKKLKSYNLNKKTVLGSIKKITPVKKTINHNHQKTQIFERNKAYYSLNENIEIPSIIKTNEITKINDTITNKSNENKNSNKKLNENINSNIIFKKVEKDIKDDKKGKKDKDNDKDIIKNKDSPQQKKINKIQINLRKEKNNDYLIKKYKLSNKEKAFLILSKSPVLILRYQLLFARSTPSLRKALSTNDILDNYDNLFKLKIEELKNKISLCNKKLEEPFVASKTAEMSLNFISTLDEAEFMYLSKLFKSKDNQYNESDIKYYYNFITLIYWLFNRKPEKNMKNIEGDKMKLLMYNEAHKRGFSGIKDCLYKLFISNAKTVNQSIILVGDNYNRIINIIKKTPDMLKYHKPLGLCKFTCFSIYLIKEILDYVEKMVNYKSLKTKSQNLLNIVYYKYEIYQTNYKNKINNE